MATLHPFDRITVEPGKCGGKPCIRGMRITVRRVLELLAAYPDRQPCSQNTLSLSLKTCSKFFATPRLPWMMSN